MSTFGLSFVGRFASFGVSFIRGVTVVIGNFLCMYYSSLVLRLFGSWTFYTDCT